MNSKNVSLVLRIDGIAFALGGLNLLAFYRPVIAFSGLPDITPTFYPRILGAMMIGMGFILWMAAHSPEDSRDVILGGIVSRTLGVIVMLAMIYVSRIDLPMPLGISGAVPLTLAAAFLIVLLVLEGLFWLNTRPEQQE